MRALYLVFEPTELSAAGGRDQLFNQTRSKYLPHPILLFDAFCPRFLHTLAELFCILYTLVGPWKQRHG